MDPSHDIDSPRIRRLAEELGEVGFEPDDDWYGLVLVELDYALRPPVHERRVPTYGAFVEPTTDPDRWEDGAQLGITRRAGGGYPVAGARRFADGMTSWVVRRASNENELMVFDRPAGSERDLAVLADVTGATVVQRHPMGVVRVVGTFGVLRWDGLSWHHEPPIAAWIESITMCQTDAQREVVGRLLEFAVHDLGARGIGAILVYQPDDDPESTIELRLPTPPPLSIARASDLAPLSHVLGQVDGAAVFDEAGRLRHLGARLSPSPAAQADVELLGGMRHTAGRRFSYDDPRSTVIVVSEDGPVTVLRAGDVVGTSSVP